MSDQYIKLKNEISTLRSKMNDMQQTDGWMNAITNLGIQGKDKRNQTEFKRTVFLDDRILADLYMGDGFAKRVVDLVADDMTREWINIEQDTDENILKKMSDLDAEFEFNKAIKWERVFGGSVILIGVNDGQEITEPLNINNIKSIDYLRTYDRSLITFSTADFESNPKSPNFGKLNQMLISPRRGTPFYVHTSRLLIFYGEPAPDQFANINDSDFWGTSIYQSTYEEIRDFGSNRGNIRNILEEFVIGIYKIKHLGSKLSTENGESKLYTRMNIINYAKSVINGVLLDADSEDYSKLSTSVAGLSDLTDRLMMFVSGVYGYPVTKLFGRSPAGMNATGEGDLKNYYDMIKAKQKNKLLKQLQTLVDLINSAKEFASKKVNEPTIKFNPLMQLTQKEIIEAQNVQAQTDKIYVDLNVLDSEEVRVSRFQKGYSFTTQLDDELRSEPEFEPFSSENE